MKRRNYARILLLIMILNVMSSLPAYALTGGPAQPEFQSFEPVTTTEMVNLPDGGFTYNLPLMDIGGYPLNLSYHSDITSDMEASCVGLGWSINPGVINRNVRALPDDFNGVDDQVKKEYNLKANTTFGASLAASYELFGFEALKNISATVSVGMNMGVFYNNYWGLGYEFGLSPGISAGNAGGSKLTASLGMSVNSQSGANFNPSLKYSGKVQSNDKNATYGVSGSVSTQISSREGLKSIQLSSGGSQDREHNEDGNKDYASTGSSLSGSYSFAGTTFTPEFSMPQTNVNVSLNYKPLGLELFGSNGSPEISGYFSRQFLSSKSESRPAYGLLYAHRGYNNQSALMDFNREKDDAFADYSTYLPIVNPGFDVLSVNGQGIGGSFQLKRGDVPVFYDPLHFAVGGGGSLGLELGFGNTAHGGVDLRFNYTTNTSHKWVDGNDVILKYNFSPQGIEGYEPAYYKAAGEMAVESDLHFYNSIGRDEAVRPDLVTIGLNPFNVSTRTQIKDRIGGFSSPSAIAPLSRLKRERRNQVISYLTASEASNVGLSRKIESYPFNSFLASTGGPVTPSMENRVNQYRKKDHLSQIEALQPDGMRYMYGIPAYNFSQKEVSFSVSTSTGLDCSSSQVTYNPGTDNSKNNTKGQDNYYSAVETPAFAHTYLLTTVLSKDYEDLTENGPTVDDFGSYTKINYTKRLDPAGSDKYHWRVPFGKNKANFNAGYYSKSHDDKATYVYGQKEIWLVHSIESKTMVAEFYYSDRADGYGVQGEDGVMAGFNFNQKLDSIVLYSKPDRYSNGSNAASIKTVHFSYNYALCPDTDNSNPAISPIRGKLTLTTLWFTYGHSDKGRLSSYKFSYKNFGNYNYSSKDYDRWGYFKPDPVNYTSASLSPDYCSHPGPTDPIGNDEFPYSEQRKSRADSSAGTWSLNRIDLPSGGTIKVDYGARHYSYVQDKPAMKLFNIVGIENPNYNLLYTASSNFLRVFFRLEDPSTTRADLQNDYLKDIRINESYLYLKCYVKMNSGSPDKWEYVSLYSQISDFGIASGGLGWVDLVPLETTDKGSQAKLNPITKWSLQKMRESLPEIAYQMTPVDENADPSIDILKPLIQMGSSIKQFVNGFNKEMTERGYAREISLKRSFIRLHVPSGFKYGGGSMVTKIVIEDNWGKMTNDPVADFQYGQEYGYTTEISRPDGTPDTISSGVASYEPLIGGDEIPFRVPASVTNQVRKLAVDNIHFVEHPLGEAFMPGPQVVFSRISVRNLRYLDVTRTATGHTVMEYYTAKDFPVKTGQTDLQKRPRRIHPLLSLLKIKLQEHMNATQGYMVETNNMHGQPKSSEVFDENGTKISGVHYHYKTSSPGVLDNTVQVIHPDGKVTNGLLGVNYSLAGDARESKTKTVSGGLALNIDGFLVGTIPATVPLPWPSFEMSEERFRSMSFTKLVHKFGILERTEAYDLGSKISTENLAYDAETGEVLLTRTYNEFDDPIYNLKYPAHWAYEGMQGAYKNIGFQSAIVQSTAPGVYKLVPSSTADTMFFPGDEVLLNGSSKAWVLHNNAVTDQLFLIDVNGQPVTMTTTTIEVIRSGRRNMASSQIGTLTSLNNPINSGYLTPVRTDSILHAEALEYGDRWQTFCGPISDCEPSHNEMGGTFLSDSCCFGSKLINPYVRNVLGEWRAERSWLYLTDRDRTSLASLQLPSAPSSTNIRKNGFYLSFNSFWNKPTVPYGLWRINLRDWIWSAETTLINPHGTELESKNRLGLYSAEILGYYQQLITGVASNSRYRQIAFEGFEDFKYDSKLNHQLSCRMPRHFGKNFEAYVTNQTYHTGKYALKIRPYFSVSDTSTLYEHCKAQITNAQGSVIMGPYKRTDCDCIQQFTPDTGRYVITAWVREGTGLGFTNYTQHNLDVKTTSQSGSFQAKGAIIDGWQRIEGEFRVKPGDQFFAVELKSIGRDEVYFDDIRIFPFNSNMKNYVYDDISLKLLAELDANGYAKFYEYSQEGELIRIKQETERGIMTIQDSWSSMPKVP